MKLTVSSDSPRRLQGLTDNTMRLRKPTFAVVFLTICSALAVAGLIFRFQHAATIPLHPPGKDSSGALTHAGALQVAKRAVKTQDTWADRAKYEVDRIGNSWRVQVTRIEPDGSNVPGGWRSIDIAADGTITNYTRGY